MKQFIVLSLEDLRDWIDLGKRGRSTNLSLRAGSLSGATWILNSCSAEVAIPRVPKARVGERSAPLGERSEPATSGGSLRPRTRAFGTRGIAPSALEEFNNNIFTFPPNREPARRLRVCPRVKSDVVCCHMFLYISEAYDALLIPSMPLISISLASISRYSSEVFTQCPERYSDEYEPPACDTHSTSWPQCSVRHGGPQNLTSSSTVQSWCHRNLKWLESYLSNRLQGVVFGGVSPLSEGCSEKDETDSHSYHGFEVLFDRPVRLEYQLVSPIRLGVLHHGMERKGKLL